MRNRAGNGNGAIEYRRQYIAALLIKRPKMTQRQIQEHLADASTKPRGEIFLNPDTDKPYCLGTINNDIQMVRAGWKDRAISDHDDWVGEEVARIQEVETEAWRVGDLVLVLKCSDRRRKLLGLDAPQKQQITGDDGGEIVIRMLGNIKPDDL